jgi:hypothetical protein
VDWLRQQKETQHQQVPTDVKDVRQHIQTLIGTFEETSKAPPEFLLTFSASRKTSEKHLLIGFFFVEVRNHSCPVAWIADEIKTMIGEGFRAVKGGIDL